MYLLKTNELAKQFSDNGGFNILEVYLTKIAPQNYQVAYNTICALWVLSYHDFALRYFEDPDMRIMEKLLKILDQFNKEKIVRIILLTVDNLKNKESCHEILSDLNAIQMITKLQNRHWVDQDISEMLERIWGFLDENYQEFSSIDKFRKEARKKVMRWGPVHTEKFWQENHMLFNDHLDVIKELIERLEVANEDDTTLSVICFDLGEFARFTDYGRNMLIAKGVKDSLTRIM